MGLLDVECSDRVQVLQGMVDDGAIDATGTLWDARSVGMKGLYGYVSVGVDH